jgi:hypothetical protein
MARAYSTISSLQSHPFDIAHLPDHLTWTYMYVRIWDGITDCPSPRRDQRMTIMPSLVKFGVTQCLVNRQHEYTSIGDCGVYAYTVRLPLRRIAQLGESIAKFDMFGACILPSDGTKVAEFFDVAQCASLLGCERCESIEVARALIYHVIARMLEFVPGLRDHADLSVTRRVEWCDGAWAYTEPLPRDRTLNVVRFSPDDPAWQRTIARLLKIQEDGIESMVALPKLRNACGITTSPVVLMTGYARLQAIVDPTAWSDRALDELDAAILVAYSDHVGADMGAGLKKLCAGTSVMLRRIIARLADATEDVPRLKDDPDASVKTSTDLLERAVASEDGRALIARFLAHNATRDNAIFKAMLRGTLGIDMRRVGTGPKCWSISVRYPGVFRKVLAAQRECL